MVDHPKDTLGYHRIRCAAIFGEDSHATKFLDKKIEESPDGPNEIVVVAETQMVHLLGQLHFQGGQE